MIGFGVRIARYRGVLGSGKKKKKKRRRRKRRWRKTSKTGVVSP